MLKINFCGDSFCKLATDESWTRQLADKLDATVVGLGKSGSALEHAFKTYDPTADYTVFCWTEPHRLYHPKYPINFTRCETEKSNSKLYGAGYVYYKYLHDYELAESRYVRELYWFDQCILSEYKGKVVHMFSFECLYEFENGTTFFTPLNLRRDVPFALDNSAEVANHFTVEQNKELADEIYSCLKP